MAEGQGDDNGDLRERTQNVRMIRELCKGRLTEKEVRKIMEHHDWDLNRTTGAILSSNPEDLRDLLGREDENELQAILKDDVIRDLLRRQSISSEIRQFACEPCDNVWWRNVPARKTVSKCLKCRIKYDAIPKDQEWGWAIFKCSCGREFSGFGQMNVTESTCYKKRGGCGKLALPSRIRPPERRDKKQKSRTRHSCNAPDCPSHFESVIDQNGHDDYHDYYVEVQPNQNLIYVQGQANGDNTNGEPHQRCSENQPGRPGLAPTCVHPISRVNKRKVIVASVPHTSTGSTVDTFLDQGDLCSLSSFQPCENNIAEEREAGIDGGR